jgi:BirA family biotin operon repressor/biotin-[acetyl-CoA-carboxylase] ligase
MNIIKIKTAVSTNLLLKELAEQQDLEEGTVVFAGIQTGGRGQKGSRWESEPGKNITCSILLYPGFLPVEQSFLLSKAVALGVKETLDSYIKNVAVKWPNDIYFEDRKLVGILIENEITGRNISQSIIGIGLNVNQEVFIGDAPNPVSLKQILDREINLNVLLEKMLKRIMYWYNQLKAGKIESVSQAYQDALYRKSGFYCYEDKNGLFNAQIQSVADDGFLHLVTDKGEERRYTFKEVSCVINKPHFDE